MPASRITRKRNINACVECRQAKTKCDSVITLQHPCTRCRLRDLECLVDSAFERMPVRQRLRAMTAELQQLRESAKGLPASIAPRQISDPDPGHGRSRSADHPQPTLHASAAPIAHAPDVSVQARSGREDIPDLECAVLGPLNLSVEDVRETFKIYREFFYHHLPIVDLSSSIGDMQKRSPFLFWTLIVIVQLRFSLIGDVAVKDACIAEYSALTRQWMLSSPLSLHDIQAILHLCAWPLPVQWQLSEPSILYTGIAINACGYLNLSRSAKKYMYQGAQLSAQNADTMSRTWLAAFSVSTTVALAMGIPPPIKSFGDILSLQEHIKHPNVPRRLAADAAMLAVIVKHNSLCVNGVDIATHEALLQLHIKELEFVRQEYQTVWYDGLEIQYLIAKLNVFVPFLLQQHQSDHAEANYLCLTTLLAGKSCAFSVIPLLQRLITPPAGEDESSTRRMFDILPKFYFRALSLALFFLVRFGAMHSGETGFDEKTREYIISTQKLLAKVSLDPDDEPGRSVRMFDRILAAEDYFSVQNPGIDEPERGGGALFWDMLRQSYRLRSWKVNRTDLLSLINPTRYSPVSDGEETPLESKKAQESDEQAYFANDIYSGIWDESMGDILNLDLFDVPGALDAGYVQGETEEII